MLLHRLDVGFY